jgi:hypothetical protein
LALALDRSGLDLIADRVVRLGLPVEIELIRWGFRPTRLRQGSLLHIACIIAGSLPFG